MCSILDPARVSPGPVPVPLSVPGRVKTKSPGFTGLYGSLQTCTLEIIYRVTGYRVAL